MGHVLACRAQGSSEARLEKIQQGDRVPLVIWPPRINTLLFMSAP